MKTLLAQLFEAQLKKPARRLSARPLVEALEERLAPAIKIEFDYRFDTSGLFSDQSRREVLRAAADEIAARLNDTLAELPERSGNFTWTAVFDNPSTPSLAFPNPVVEQTFTLPAHTLKIFVGGRPFDTPGASLARPKIGVVRTVGDAAWDAFIKSRGEAGAALTPPTDVGPWGGSIAFDSRHANWYFGLNERDPNNPINPTDTDFFSVAQRAIGQILGFGTTEAWNRFHVDKAFRGPNATELYGGPVPVETLSTIGTFWRNELQWAGGSVAMDIAYGVKDTGKRVHFTNLDLAALHDTGWEVTYPPGTPAPSPDGNGTQVVVKGIAGLAPVKGPNPFVFRTPSEVAFNGRIYRAGVDNDRGLWVDVSGDGGQTFRDRNDFGGGDEAEGSPTLAVHNDQLYMAWIGTDSDYRVNIATIGTAANGAPTSLAKTVLGYTSDRFLSGFGSGIALESHLGALFMAWTGEDEKVNLDFISEAKPQWGDAFETRQPSNKKPSLASRDNRLGLLWTDSNNVSQIRAVELIAETRGRLEAFPLQNGTLTVLGDRSGVAFDDTLLIEQSESGGVKITLNGAVTRFPGKQVFRVVVNTGGGNDTVIVRPDLFSLLVDVWLGDGNDTLTAERALGGLYVNGELGDDVIDLEYLRRDATARLDGGPGDDTFALGNQLQTLNNIQGSVVVDGTWVGNDRLTLNDRQSGADQPFFFPTYTLTPDVVYLPNGFGAVTLARIGSLHLTAPQAGFPSVNVHGTAVSVHTVIDDAASVVLGGPHPSPFVAGTFTEFIRGPVQIENSSRPTALTITDTGNSRRRDITLESRRVLGLTDHPIVFNNIFSSSTTISSLTINAGSGGNTVVVSSTLSPDRVGPITLNTGTGADTVRVERVNTPVTVNGQRGRDVVHLGLNQSLEGILNTVTVTNLAEWSEVNLDDRADATADVAALQFSGAFTEIVGLAPALIRLRSQDLSALNIWAGTGNNMFDVFTTPASTFPGGAPTNLHTGTGHDAVTVYRTFGALNLDVQEGLNQVRVSSPTSGLDKIDGPVSVRGTGGLNFLTVSDAASTTTHTYVLDRNLVQRTDKAAIFYQDLTSLSVLAGATYDTIAVRDTTPGLITDVQSSGGDDYIAVTRTTGRLSVKAGGSSFIEVGNNVSSLDAIQGAINVDTVGGNSMTLRLVDTATTHQTLTADANVFGQTYMRSGAAAITAYFSPVANFEYAGGSGGTTGFIYGTPAGTTTSLYGRAGVLDNFYPGWAGDMNRNLGRIFLNGQAADNDYAIYYDYLNPNPQTYTFTGDSFFRTLFIDRPGTGGVSSIGLGQVVFYAPRGGGSVENVRGVPVGTFLNMAVGADVVTIGGGPLGLFVIQGPVAVAGYVDANVTMTVDNNGDFRTGSRLVTLRERQGPYDYGHHIEGFAPAAIYWRLEGNSTLDLRGGAADETFALLSTTFGIPITINGGGGVNTLDYSGYNSATSGLVSWYQGENNAGDSVGGNPGTLHGNVTFVPGKDGQAFDFDGSGGYVDLGSGPSLDLPGSLSVSMWVRLDTYTPWKYFFGDFYSGGAARQGSLGVGLTPFWEQSYTNGEWNRLEATTRMQVGQWYHLGVVRDDATKTVRLYVNGMEEASLNYNYAGWTVVPLQSSKFLGGAGPDFPISSMDGQLDEVGIFNRALSAAEVQALYSGSSTVLQGNGQGVTVNLPLGTATGLHSIANIRNVVGSSGNDILVGNGGNVLFGGFGRDLLIAGALASQLYGGGDEDLLIGGTTAHDTYRAALDRVMAEWTSAADYETRVANLRAGLLGADSVSSNGQQNTLNGEGGRDAFFGSLLDLMDRLEDEVFVEV